MKKTILKIRRYFANKKYNKMFHDACLLAEQKHKQTHKRVYLIDNPQDEKQLLLVTTKEFLEIRHLLGISSKVCKVADIQRGAWYYTANENEKDRLDPRDLVRRRMGFIQDRMIQKGLITIKKDSE